MIGLRRTYSAKQLFPPFFLALLQALRSLLRPRADPRQGVLRHWRAGMADAKVLALCFGP